MPTKAALSLPFLSWTGERKYNERFMTRDKDREITQQLPSRTKQTRLGEINFNLLPIKGQSSIIRNKNNLKTPSPHPSLLPGLTFAPNFSTSSPRAAQGDGERGLPSVHYALSLLFLPPHVLQCGIPPTGDSPLQTSPMWVLPTGCSSS